MLACVGLIIHTPVVALILEIAVHITPRPPFEPAIEAIPNLGVIALLAVGTWRVSTGDTTAGDVVQSMLLLQILIFPMRVFGFFLEELPRTLVAAARLQRVVAEVDDVDGAAPAAASTMLTTSSQLVTAIRLSSSLERPTPM